MHALLSKSAVADSLSAPDLAVLERHIARYLVLEKLIVDAVVAIELRVARALEVPLGLQRAADLGLTCFLPDEGEGSTMRRALEAAFGVVLPDAGAVDETPRAPASRPRRVERRLDTR